MKQAVIGLGYGDEGKGLATSFLCSLIDPDGGLVVRFNGGHQAGHTVCIGKERHVFSSFGSGTMQGFSTYWAEQCTFSPRAFLVERELLRKYNPILFIHPLCPVTTPFDVIRNRIDMSNGHGTVGVGFGNTLQRHEDHYKIHVQDLYYPTVLKMKLEMVAKYYGMVNMGAEIDLFLHEAELASDNITVLTYEEISDFDNVIYEGAQGILLDQDFGFFPNVTRSYTTTRNITEELDDIYYVTRTYSTRHGNGPLHSEQKMIIGNNENETNKNGSYQGDFRTGPLNIEFINYALECDSTFHPNATKNLIITCMDQHPIDHLRMLGNIEKNLNKVFLSYGPSYKDIKIM